MKAAKKKEELLCMRLLSRTRRSRPRKGPGLVMELELMRAVMLGRSSCQREVY